MKDKKSKQLPTTVITKPLQEEFEKFIECVPARRLSANLRNLLVWYLLYSDGEHFFDFDDLLADLTWLFDLLDIADGEYKPLTHGKP